jgi:hypothetical protein
LQYKHNQIIYLKAENERLKKKINEIINNYKEGFNNLWEKYNFTDEDYEKIIEIEGGKIKSAIGKFMIIEKELKDEN